MTQCNGGVGRENDIALGMAADDGIGAPMRRQVVPAELGPSTPHEPYRALGHRRGIERSSPAVRLVQPERLEAGSALDDARVRVRPTGNAANVGLGELVHLGTNMST